MKKPVKRPFELTAESLMQSPEIVAAIMLAASIDTAVSKICVELGVLTQAIKQKGTKIEI
jgi:hypothetical protein